MKRSRASRGSAATEITRAALASQFHAALDMLDNAVAACPRSLWGAGETPHAFWYLTFHTLFWLDYYFASDAAAYRPPRPFTRGEMDPAGVYPERVYSKAQLRRFLARGRRSLDAALARLDAQSGSRRASTRPEISELELVLYSLRHVHHHVGQLQLLLRQHGAEPPRWVRSGPTRRVSTRSRS